MKFGDSIFDIEFSPHKIMPLYPKLSALASGSDDVYPSTVEVDLVSYCNHNCKWCVDPAHGRSRLEMGFVGKLFEELRFLQVAGIVFKGGGESTLHPRFEDALELARQQGFEAGVVTNGSMLHRRAGALASLASYVRVSIDGPTPESHAALHGSDDFETIVEGVVKLVQERNRLKRRHPVVGLSFAMDFHAMDLVETAVELGERVACDYVLFRPPFFEEVGAEPTMTPMEALQVRRRFMDVRSAYKGDMKILVDHWISDRDAELSEIFQADSPRRGSFVARNANGIEHVTGRCLASPLLAVVTGDQSLYGCCNLRSLPEWKFGRIDYDEGLTFEKVYMGKRRKMVLEKMRRFACRRYCTHPLSRYNEIIEYLKSPRHHGSFV